MINQAVINTAEGDVRSHDLTATECLLTIARLTGMNPEDCLVAVLATRREIDAYQQQLAARETAIAQAASRL